MAAHTNQNAVLDAKRIEIGRYVKNQSGKVAATSSTAVQVQGGAVPHSHQTHEKVS